MSSSFDTTSLLEALTSTQVHTIPATATSSLPTTAEKANILSLSAELHDHIFFQLPRSYNWIDSHSTSSQSSALLGLSTTCRQLRSRAYDNHLSTAIFALDLRSEYDDSRSQAVRRRAEFVSLVHKRAADFQEIRTMHFHCTYTTIRISLRLNGAIEKCTIEPRQADVDSIMRKEGVLETATQFLRRAIAECAILSNGKCDWYQVYKAVGLVTAFLCQMRTWRAGGSTDLEWSAGSRAMLTEHVRASQCCAKWSDALSQ